MQSHTASLLGLLTLVTLLSTASELHRKPPYLCAESKNIQVLAYLSEACVTSQHYAHISVCFHQSLVQQQ